MTIQQPDTVDGMGVDKRMNELVLLISDHLPWEDEEAHLSALENKLGGYLNYLTSGQYLEAVPQSKGLPVRIKLVHEHRPTASAETILQAVEAQLVAMDIRFSHEALPTKY
ncbi:DUF6572 domain-containing protein [Asticcacaulis solisilvae]|uniref:DUF6572 domain-containing protein n=1 Tax=Asticcacaulis solisilvae TaxID=1217274 RepID=UPI003FD71573